MDIEFIESTNDDKSGFCLPVFEVRQSGLEQIDSGWIHFVKGSSTGEGRKQAGFVSESLLEAVRDYLVSVNAGKLANRETSAAITKIDEALLWLGKRKADRKKRKVLNTYKP